MARIARLLAGWVFAAILLVGLAGGARADTVVYAAASATDALNEVAAAFAAKGLGKIVPSYDSSSTLAKQIENGAPAGVFMSADEQWMDYLDKKNLIAPDTRVDLLGNALVLIAPKTASPTQVKIGPGFDLAKLLGDGRLAVGDPAHVPAGLYAKAALEKLGAWTAVEAKLAMAENIRAALVLVARGEAPLGIVYETDAKVEPGVKILGVFPEDSHPPIVYPAALTANAKPDAAQYLAFLRTQAAKSIFEHYGFNFLIRPTS